MSRDPFFALDATIRRNRKMARLPNDSARYGWVAGVLGEAKLLRPGGRFDSRAHFKAVLNGYAKFLPDYLSATLIEEAPNLCERCLKAWGAVPDGSLIVHDWRVHQRDPNAPQRAQEWRENAERTADERTTNAESTPNDTASRARISLSPVSLSQSSGTEGGPGGTDPPLVTAIRYIEDETGRPWGIRPGNRTYDTLAADLETFGLERVLAALAAVERPVHDAAMIVWPAHKSLAPIAITDRSKPKPKGYLPSDEEVNRAFDAS